MNQELIYDVSEKEIEGKPYMRLRSSTHEFYFWKNENVSEKDLMVLNSVVEYLSTPKYGTFVRVPRSSFPVWQIPKMHDLFDDSFSKMLESGNIDYLLAALGVNKDRNIINVQTALKNAKDEAYEKIKLALSVIEGLNSNQIIPVMRVLLYESLKRLDELSKVATTEKDILNAELCMEYLFNFCSHFSEFNNSLITDTASAVKVLDRLFFTRNQVYDLTVPYILHLWDERNTMIFELLSFYKKYLLATKALDLSTGNVITLESNRDDSLPKLQPTETIISEAIERFTWSKTYKEDVIELLDVFVDLRFQFETLSYSRIVREYYETKKGKHKYDSGSPRTNGVRWLKGFVTMVTQDYWMYDWGFLKSRERKSK